MLYAVGVDRPAYGAVLVDVVKLGRCGVLIAAERPATCPVLTEG